MMKVIKIILNDIKKIANYKIKDIKIVKSLGKKDFFGFLNLINKKIIFQYVLVILHQE